MTTDAASWGQDLRRILSITAGIALFATILIGLAAAGILESKPRYEDNPVDADATWAGIVAMVGCLLFPVQLFRKDRRDLGFRREGLVPLLLVGILGGGLVQVLFMMTWPFLLGDNAVPGTVAAELTTDPASIGLLFLLLVAAASWFTAIVLGMVFGAKAVIVMGGGLKTMMVFGLLGAVLFIGALFLFMFASVDVFDSPPSADRFVVWGLAAVAGLAALVSTGLLRGLADSE